MLLSNVFVLILVSKASGTRNVFFCWIAGYAGYLAGYHTGNGLSAGSAVRYSAGFS